MRFVCFVCTAWAILVTDPPSVWALKDIWKCRFRVSSLSGRWRVFAFVVILTCMGFAIAFEVQHFSFVETKSYWITCVSRSPSCSVCFEIDGVEIRVVVGDCCVIYSKSVWNVTEWPRKLTWGSFFHRWRVSAVFVKSMCMGFTMVSEMPSRDI